MRLHLSTGPHLLARTSTRSIMLDVIIALLPAAAAGLYLFGLGAAVVLGSAVLSAVAAEALWQWLAKKPIQINDLSAALTGLLVGLNLPSSAPWWLAVIGSAVAVLLVKQLFGGIGQNFLNPALAARAVLLASWPARMTVFMLPQRLIQLGGTSAVEELDAVAKATPLAGGFSTFDLLMGNIPGTIGEVCKVAILIGFVYLVLRKVIGPQIPVVFIGTVALMTWILGGDPLAAILSGGVLFGAVFMATDYVTNPMLFGGQCVFAVGCGVLVVLIRKFAAYPEGVTYAILLMNIVTPLIDKFSKRRIYGEVKQHG
ncbi:MAG: RnfABCDGE type electron transport complex subunit D [Oscillospiraceae bacterium]|jgi:electron transport complex protein RnfD|nr:RnfABCDGE type electron transport complex subunit D [Oscillospiraceae bacterium]